MPAPVPVTCQNRVTVGEPNSLRTELNPTGFRRRPGDKNEEPIDRLENLLRIGFEPNAHLALQTVGAEDFPYDHVRGWVFIRQGIQRLLAGGPDHDDGLQVQGQECPSR